MFALMKWGIGYADEFNRETGWRFMTYLDKWKFDTVEEAKTKIQKLINEGFKESDLMIVTVVVT
jgi:hypothetical protein